MPGIEPFNEVVESDAPFGRARPLSAFLAVCAVGTSAFFLEPVLATAAGLLFGVPAGTAPAVMGHCCRVDRFRAGPAPRQVRDGAA